MNTHRLLINLYRLTYWYHRLAQMLWLVIQVAAVMLGVIFIITIIVTSPSAVSSRSSRGGRPALPVDLTLLWLVLLPVAALTIGSAVEYVMKWRMKIASRLYLGRAWRWLQLGVAIGSVVALISVRHMPGLPPLFWGTLYALAWLVAIGVPIFGLWLGLAGWHSVAYRYIIFWIALAIGKVRCWLLSGWRGVLIVLAATTALAWVYSQLLGARRALIEFLTPDLALQVLAIDAVIVVLYWASHARRSIVVLGFADDTGDSNLKASVDGISSRLFNELIGLARLYQSIEGYSTLSSDQDIRGAETVSSKEGEKAAGKLTGQATLHTADIGQTLQGITTTDSKIKLGVLEIPIGFLAATFGRLVEGPRLSGSLQRVGNQLVLLATIAGGNLRGNWRVNQSDLNLEEAPATGDTYVVEQLVHQLAYRVFTDLEQDRLGSVRWRAVYWFSDALRAYRDAGQSQFDRVAHLVRAERAFTRTLSYDERFAQCHYNLGVTYLLLDKREFAQLSFERAGQLDPNFADAYYALADFYWNYTGPEDLWTSVRYFDHILLMRPGEARAWRLKAITLRSLNDERQLRRSPFQRERAWAIEQASVAVALAWRQLCRWAWHNELSRPRQAITARYLQIHGLLLDDVYHLGSQAVLRQALYLAPDDASIHVNIGWALSREGNFAGAIRAFQTAAQMSNRPEDWEYLAWACQWRFTFIHTVFEHLKIKRRRKLPAPVAAAEASAWSNLLQLADRHEDKQFEDAVDFIGKPMSKLDRGTRRVLAVRRRLEYAREAARQLGEKTYTADSRETLSEWDRLISKLIQRRDFYAKHDHYYRASLIARQLAQFGVDFELRRLLREAVEMIPRQTIESLQDLQKVIEPADDLRQTIEQLQNLQRSLIRRTDEQLNNLQQAIEPLWDLRSSGTSYSRYFGEQRWAIRGRVLDKILDQVRRLQQALTDHDEDVRQSLDGMVEQLRNLQRTLECDDDLRQNLASMVKQLQNLQQTPLGPDGELTTSFQPIIEELQKLERAVREVRRLEQAIHQVQKLGEATEPIENLRLAIKWLEECELTQSIRFFGLPGILADTSIRAANGSYREWIHEAGREAERETIASALEQAVAFDPYEPTARQQLGRFNLLNHHFDRAEQELTNSVKLQPNSPDSVQWLALAHWTHAMSAPDSITRRAELQCGVTALEQLLDLIEKQSSPIRSYQVTFKSESRGWAHYWLGRFHGELLAHAAALAHLQVAVSLGYAVYEAQLEMGRIYLRCRTYNQAEQCFRDVMQRGRTMHEPYHSRINDEPKQPEEWIATAQLFLALAIADRGADLRQSRRLVADAARGLGHIRSVIWARRDEYAALLLSCMGWLDFIAVREDAIDDELKAPRLAKAARRLEKSVSLVASAEGYFKLGRVYTEYARLEPGSCERWSARAARAYRRARDLDLRGEYMTELDGLLKPAEKSEKLTPRVIELHVKDE